MQRFAGLKKNGGVPYFRDQVAAEAAIRMAASVTQPFAPDLEKIVDLAVKLADALEQKLAER
jgi:hypothetical protein